MHCLLTTAAYMSLLNQFTKSTKLRTYCFIIDAIALPWSSQFSMVNWWMNGWWMNASWVFRTDLLDYLELKLQFIQEWKFCHHLCTLILFKSCMQHKRSYFKVCWQTNIFGYQWPSSYGQEKKKLKETCLKYHFMFHRRK